jgi:hypothetical protein
MRWLPHRRDDMKKSLGYSDLVGINNAVRSALDQINVDIDCEIESAGDGWTKHADTAAEVIRLTAIGKELRDSFDATDDALEDALDIDSVMPVEQLHHRDHVLGMLTEQIDILSEQIEFHLEFDAGRKPKVTVLEVNRASDLTTMYIVKQGLTEMADLIRAQPESLDESPPAEPVTEAELDEADKLTAIYDRSMAVHAAADARRAARAAN